MNVSEAEKGKAYELAYPSDKLTAWKESGGSAYDYMLGEQLSSEIADLSKEQKKKTYSYVANAKNYTTQQKVAWLLSDSQKTEGKAYKAWKGTKGTDGDYIKHRANLERFEGMETKKKEASIVSYIKGQTSDRSKQKALFQMAGYQLDSSKNGKTIKDGNFNKKMGYK